MTAPSLSLPLPLCLSAITAVGAHLTGAPSRLHAATNVTLTSALLMTSYSICSSKA